MVVSKSATQTYEQYSGDVEIMLVKKYNDLDSAMTYDGKYEEAQEQRKMPSGNQAKYYGIGNIVRIKEKNAKALYDRK